MAREIPLTQGKVAIVDDEDYELVIKYGWTTHSIHKKGRVVREYVRVSNPRKHGTLYLHQLINQTPPGMKTDHRNGNPLDNRRCNLRTATNAENSRNRVGGSGNTSGYKGVSFFKRDKRWRAYLVLNGKQIHLGYFNDPIAAAKTADAAALTHHGSFAKLNFPPLPQT